MLPQHQLYMFHTENVPKINEDEFAAEAKLVAEIRKAIPMFVEQDYEECLKLMTIKSPVYRLIAALGLKFFVRNCDTFRDIIRANQTGELVTMLTTVLFMEDNLAVKTAMAELMCDITKMFRDDVLQSLITKVNFIDSTLRSVTYLAR